MPLQSLKPITLMWANASGKTEIALELARRLGGEIISADSKQIYRSLEAGTAKPHGTWTDTPAGLAYLVEGVPYHLVDTLDPRAAYDAGSFVKEAKKLIPELTARGKVPIMAGGTGMYIQAFWNGLDELPPADPAAALRIPPGNIQRVMRAIEITRLAGRPVSQIWSGRFFDALPAHEGKFIFIKWQKDLLAERVKSRTAARFDEWAQETRELLGKGYAEDCPGLKTLGYPQIMDYLTGRLTKPEAMRAITAATMAYAKRQNTWFGRYRNAALLELTKLEDYDPSSLAEKIINA